jgi:hypothetical protein
MQQRSGCEPLHGWFYMAVVFSGSDHMQKRDWQTRAPKHDKRNEVVDVGKAVAGADTELNLVVRSFDAGIGKAVANSRQYRFFVPPELAA